MNLKLRYAAPIAIGSGLFMLSCPAWAGGDHHYPHPTPSVTTTTPAPEPSGSTTEPEPEPSGSTTEPTPQPSDTPSTEPTEEPAPEPSATETEQEPAPVATEPEAPSDAPAPAEEPQPAASQQAPTLTVVDRPALDQPSDELAYTGVSAGALAAVGASAVGVGGLVLLARRRLL